MNDMPWTIPGLSQAPKRPARAGRFLSWLPSRIRDAFVARCDRVTLQCGEILARPSEEMKHVYFPVTCYISQAASNERVPIEVNKTGEEGMVGLALALGVARSPVLVSVQGEGEALRMAAPAFAGEMRDTPALRKLVFRYAHVCLAQSAIQISCARFHSVEQRVARWLLATSDRAGSRSFPMTQRQLATLIGVRRVGVTNAASALQSRGIVSYSRGSMHILDSDALRGTACRCYQDDLDIYQGEFGAGSAAEEAVPAPAEPLNVRRLQRV